MPVVVALRRLLSRLRRVRFGLTDACERGPTPKEDQR